MDLRITIRDENEEILKTINVYQDGSDSRGVERIVEFIEENFEIETENGLWWSRGSAEIEIEIPRDIVESVAVSGDNECAVRMALPRLKKTLDAFDPKLIRKVVGEYMGDLTEEELADEEMCRVRLIWIACWDIHETKYQENSHE